MTDTDKTVLLGFPDYAPQARTLATVLGVPYADLELHRLINGTGRA